MNSQQRKDYQKAYRQAHKEERKAYRQAHKEEIKAYAKKYKQEHKEEIKARVKKYYQEHKEEINARAKKYNQAHKEEIKAYRQAHKEEIKAYRQAHKEEIKAYQKSDVNSFGESKHSIRMKSRQILKKMNLHIPGYEIHHCFGYEDASKFIYISKSLHLKIHQYLRDHSIDASSDHWMDIRDMVNNKYEFTFIKC